jgi:hypothetical protein
VPATDYVSTFRGEGVQRDLVGLAVADHVCFLTVVLVVLTVAILSLTYRLD